VVIFKYLEIFRNPMVYMSPKKEIGLVMGIYYHIEMDKLAEHYRIRVKTAQDTLKRLQEEGKDNLILDYLKSAEPYYEQIAETAHGGKPPRFKQGIDVLVRTFGVKRKDIYSVEDDICPLKRRILLHKTE
jgi:hypothetical protein